MSPAFQGLDRGAAPPAATAKKMLDTIDGRWWCVYIGGPYYSIDGWSPEIVREYVRHGIDRFMLTYVGQQAGGQYKDRRAHPRAGTEGRARGAGARQDLRLHRRLPALPRRRELHLQPFPVEDDRVHPGLVRHGPRSGRSPWRLRESRTASGHGEGQGAGGLRVGCELGEHDRKPPRPARGPRAYPPTSGSAPASARGSTAGSSTGSRATSSASTWTSTWPTSAASRRRRTGRRSRPASARERFAGAIAARGSCAPPIACPFCGRPRRIGRISTDREAGSTPRPRPR